jgi:hypothetical protein
MSKGKNNMEIYGSDIRGGSFMRGVLERVEAFLNPQNPKIKQSR